jgi:hypothetical protein
VDHLLLHCEIASALWNTIFGHVRLACVMPRRVVNLFACWKEQLGSIQNAAMCLSCLMWCLWRKRNDQSFKDNERMVVELKAFLQDTLSLGSCL